MASHDPSTTFTRQQRANLAPADGANDAPHVHHHARSVSQSAVGTTNPARRSQNYAAKAAAARLAQFMTLHSTDNDDEDDVDFLHSQQQQQRQQRTSSNPLPATSSVPSSGIVGRRDASPRLPRFSVVAESRDQSPRFRAPAYNTGRDSGAARESGNHHPSLPQTNAGSRSKATTAFSSSYSATSRVSNDPSPENFRDGPVPVRENRIPSSEIPISHSKPRRNGRREEAALQDEIDLLQEDYDNVLTKLRAAEEKAQEKELRIRELEKQVVSLGEGISLEARLLNRKEAALRQREEALRAAKEHTSYEKDDEIAALRLEVDSAKDELAVATDRAAVSEKEVHGLRSITSRMILTHEEMEEMVLKRCWLARYWGLATRHGVQAEVASSKHEHWSALAPLPLEVVISAGHSDGGDSTGMHRKTPSRRDLSDITGEGNVEAMLAVEKGLREMSLLKVEQSVMFAMMQRNNPSLGRTELSPEEVEDVQFKHAWLVYFWRRAKSFKVESDIAEERLSYWMVRSNQPPTPQDVVDVERGLLELHKLGIEEQLWEASRREVSQATENERDEER